MLECCAQGCKSLGGGHRRYLRRASGMKARQTPPRRVLPSPLTTKVLQILSGGGEWRRPGTATPLYRWKQASGEWKTERPHDFWRRTLGAQPLRPRTPCELRRWMNLRRQSPAYYHRRKGWCPSGVRSQSVQGRSCRWPAINKLTISQFRSRRYGQGEGSVKNASTSKPLPAVGEGVY